MQVEVLQSSMLAIAQERAVEPILKRIVVGLNEASKMALVRIWLKGRADLCAQCHFRADCPERTGCLHLVASAGRGQFSGVEHVNLDGKFRRIPLGVRKIGVVGASGEPFLIANVSPNESWVDNPTWVAEEKIQSFAGQPLIFRGEILGVLGVFARTPLSPEDFRWIRIFADHAAAAIAHARAFEEIQSLKIRLEEENNYLQEEVKNALDFGDILGRSPALQKTLRQIDLVAGADASVLILGESGVGKELVARAIHRRSPRRACALIKVNCGAIPHELFESEFFGHVKGAFTGAIKDRAGRFELADGGTLFLDEVGEIPLSLQAKLLRVLQEHQFERVGDERTRTANVRIVAATNRDLQKEVEAGRFRQDLFYRLSVFPIEVPPLRERKEDIPVLAAHFLKAGAQKMNLKPSRLTAEDAALLRAYSWPGNVRELQNVIERAIILSQGGPLRFDLASSGARPLVPRTGVLTREELKQYERESIRAALAQTNGKVFGANGAAALLGMKGTTLASRIKALGLKQV